MKKPYYLLLLCSLIVLFDSCSDDFYSDLSHKHVTLSFPYHDYVSNVETIVFRWEELFRAKTYQIRIVSPSFDNITTTHVDEMITTTSYATSLAPGEYEWSVIALNDGSQTDSVEIRQIMIYEEATLENQIVNIIAPIDYHEAKDSVQLHWNTLSNAAYYRIQVTTTTFSDPSSIILEDTVSSDNYMIGLPEGSYAWRIRAEDSSSVSAYTTQQLIIDQTPPIAPILTNYFNGDTVRISNIYLEWTAEPDVRRDTIYIYTDNLLNNQIIKRTAWGIYRFSDTTATQYYWQVRSVDKAGNVGMYSSVGHFILDD